MQAAIILVLMAVFLSFSVAEMGRNDSSNTIESFKAENVAANILQYQDSIMQYGRANYDLLHLAVSINPGNIEQVTPIDYTANGLAKYNQKNLLLFLNYKSVFFNYTNSSESNPMPVLYAATSWYGDGYTNDVVQGYAKVSMPEIMGELGSNLSKRLYQGDSTYWVVPWVFSQSGCNITELYSQLPNDSSGNSMFDKLNSIFSLFCKQLKDKGYTFKQYVYISPVFIKSDT
ncbi:MAG: hypothetical protein K0R94_1361 [Burkholderiales bacterium]|nr:hypothetical protein [Burkholderiales bacterium]